MIDIRELTVEFSTLRPFHGYSLQVGEGEKCVLTGPSGRGKSTLLNVILGFVKPNEGEVIIGGKELGVETIHAIRSQVGYLPQDLSLDVQTGEELLFYPYTFRSNRLRKPSSSRVKEMLGRLLLSERILHSSARELSGGERQRVMLASVLLMEKPLLLLDEPTSALDAESTECVIDVIRSMDRVTVLSVSHDPRWIQRMDRIVNV